MQPLIICSVGVHAMEMAEIIERINRAAPTWHLLGYFSERRRIAKHAGRTLNGYPVLGTIDDLPKYPHAALAIGNEFGDPFPIERAATIIDPSAFIARSAKIGRGCVIYPGCYVGYHAVIGDRVFVLSGSTINHDDVLEDHIAMASGVTLAGGVHVEEGCYLGQTCSVRQNLRIGKGSLVGLGTVVVKDVPPNCVMVGNPARKLKDRKPVVPAAAPAPAPRPAQQPATRSQPIVGLHLDLKYFMPRKTYLPRWLREVAASGINTLLLEYEDKFPFQRHPFLRDPEAFTPGELREFLAVARGAGLRVVPLVQTLSHLEFALNHAELADLRELPDVPSQICPSNPRAVQFIRDLLAEVLEFHREDECFHIGADETWFLGACPTCQTRAAGDPLKLWLENTETMARFLRENGKRVLCWDDTFWKTPHRAAELSSDITIASWNYGVRPDTRERMAELVGRVQAYRGAGHEVLGCPCLNWGVLFPRPETYENTRAWADVARRHDCQGLINTAWTVFHLPLPTFFPQIAATALLANDPAASVGAEWQADYFQRRFGVATDGLPAALATLGEIWEVVCEGIGRPITPVGYGYMDMVLHFPGGQDERRRRSVYPLDWNEIDFPALYRRKLDLLKNHPDLANLRTRLADLLPRYASAVATLESLAGRAASHPEEAALLLALGRTKLAGARILDHHLNGTGSADELRREGPALRAALEAALAPFYEPASVERKARIWCDPITASLGGA